ncbi:hypothetical protein VNO80_01467 [Phaseolus coccineus]|uniref:LisH domain-containing protein n=1 Tax=Phaseolus coccineus TaxID=3886 RepID=A0AAN9RSW6_PHACN
MTCERGNLSRPLLAFIVDQYLSRNQFSQTRASFRNEASSVFANARPNQNLLSLEEMMNQYIRMKKQNIELDKEKMMLMQEKNRIQKLLQDMQNALDIFNVRSPSNVAAMITNSALVPPVQNSNTTPPVASNTMWLPPKSMNNVNFSSPMISASGMKRKDSPSVDGSVAAKKRRGRPPTKKKQVQPLPCAFNKADFGSSSAITQSLIGNLPVRASHISHDVSPSTHISPVATRNGEVIAPSYNVISTNKRVIVQPQEQMVYNQEQMVYKEGNRDISPLEASKRDMADRTNMRALDVNCSHILENLDKSSSNEIPISDKERDNSAHLDFSGLDYCLEASNFPGSEHLFGDWPLEPYVMPPRSVREMRARARRAMVRAQKKVEQQEQNGDGKKRKNREVQEETA